MMNDIQLTRQELACFERLVSPDDVTVRSIILPPDVHGFVRQDPDGHYNVYVNARDPRWRQYRALQHELDHIYAGDLWSDAPIEDIEK